MLRGGVIRFIIKMHIYIYLFGNPITAHTRICDITKESADFFDDSGIYARVMKAYDEVFAQNNGGVGGADGACCRAAMTLRLNRQLRHCKS